MSVIIPVVAADGAKYTVTLPDPPVATNTEILGVTTAPVSMDTGNGNLLLAQPETLSQAGTVQSMSINVGTAAGQVILGIYDSTGANGAPGALKASTAAFTPVSGWNTQPVQTPVSLAAGNYYLAHTPSSSSLTYGRASASGSATSGSVARPFGALPATCPTLGSPTVTNWSVYASLSSTAPPPPPPTSLVLGYATNGTTVPSFTRAQADDLMGKIVSVGGKWVRSYATDTLIASAKAAGLKCLYTPIFGSGDSVSSVVSKVMSRLASPSGVVDAVEVGNELNYVMSAATYMTYLSAVYSAVKAKYPNVLVGSAGTGPGSGSQAPITWIQACYSAGLKNSSDFVAHHPYCFGNPYVVPGDPSTIGWSAFMQVYATSPSIRSVMVAAGDSNKQIWMTEFGAPTGTSSDSITQAQQADYFSKGLPILSGLSYCGPIFLYEVIDQGPSTPSNPTREGYFGSWTQAPTESPKPAVAAIKALTGAH